MKSSRTYSAYPTAYGALTLGASTSGITEVHLGAVRCDGVHQATHLTTLCATEILEYLAGKRRRFTVPLDIQGTDFQKQVWQAVRTIAYGHTETPRAIAQAIGAPQSYRLVGAALRANPLPILIPTHRVIGAAGYPLGTDKNARLLHSCLLLEQRTLAKD